MKNNCQFNTAKFYQYDCIPHETTNCYRIITDNGVYFFYEYQFIDVNILDNLEEGDVIHIGCHALNDGTFWLHWLVSWKGDLAIRDKLHYSIPHRYILLMPFLILIGFWFDLQLITIFLFFGLIFILMWCICRTLFRLINLLLPKQIFLRKRYHRLKQSDLSFMKSPLSKNRKTLSCSLTDLPVYEGIATNINSSLISRGTRLSFDFNGVRLSFNEYDLTNYFIPIIYYFCHPTFIAPGDKLSLVFENNKIQGIFNHTDGSSYLITHCVWISKQKAKTLLRYWYFYTISAPIAFILLVILPSEKLDVIINIFLWIFPLAQIIPLLFLLFYTLFSYLNDRSYTKRVLKWLYETTGHWPKEI